MIDRQNPQIYIFLTLLAKFAIFLLRFIDEKHKPNDKIWNWRSVYALIGKMTTRFMMEI